MPHKNFCQCNNFSYDAFCHKNFPFFHFFCVPLRLRDVLFSKLLKFCTQNKRKPRNGTFQLLLRCDCDVSYSSFIIFNIVVKIRLSVKVEIVFLWNHGTCITEKKYYSKLLCNVRCWWVQCWNWIVHCWKCSVDLLFVPYVFCYTTLLSANTLIMARTPLRARLISIKISPRRVITINIPHYCHKLQKIPVPESPFRKKTRSISINLCKTRALNHIKIDKTNNL